MKGKVKILFVEDINSDAELMMRAIAKKGIAFESRLIDNKKDFIESLESFKPDIIISDYSLPGFDGMAVLKLRNELSLFTPFIFVTGSRNETMALECIKAGADDYILKDNFSGLGLAVTGAINKITSG